MRGSRKFRQEGPDNVVFNGMSVFYRGPYEPPSRSNWTPGSNCFSRGSVPVFLRKHIATWDFLQGRGFGPPLDSSMISLYWDIVLPTPRGTATAVVTP